MFKQKPYENMEKPNCYDVGSDVVLASQVIPVRSSSLVLTGMVLWSLAHVRGRIGLGVSFKKMLQQAGAKKHINFHVQNGALE